LLEKVGDSGILKADIKEGSGKKEVFYQKSSRVSRRHKDLGTGLEERALTTGAGPTGEKKKKKMLPVGRRKKDRPAGRRRGGVMVWPPSFGGERV